MQICEQALRDIIETSGPVKLVIGGPPCEDLALVNADRTGVKGPKSRLLHIIFVVLDWLTILQPEQEVHFLVENTARQCFNLPSSPRNLPRRWPPSQDPGRHLPSKMPLLEKRVAPAGTMPQCPTGLRLCICIAEC